MKQLLQLPLLVLLLLVIHTDVLAVSEDLRSSIFEPGQLKPVDSTLKVSAGDKAPPFRLPSIRGPEISLDDYLGKKNVVLSFIPAAWTPVCSDQWPGYNITRGIFEQYNTVLIGLSVDNIPTLHAWTRQMGTLWFDVLSDFWPHGGVAEKFGLLRSDGVAERALVYINMNGIITHVHVSDINIRPPLEGIVEQLKKF